MLRLALAVAAVLCWLSVFVGLAACGSGPDATEATAVDGDAMSGDPAVDVWSPDGTRLAFSDYREDDYGGGDYEIFVVSMGGSASPQQVTDNSPSDDLIGPRLGSWSPDSSQIAFSRDFGPSTTDSRPDNFTKVFVTDADGTNLRQLTHNNSHDYVVSWQLRPWATTADPRPRPRLWPASLWPEGSEPASTTTAAATEDLHARLIGGLIQDLILK